MTLSRDNRLKNMENALKLMLGRLGDRGMYAEFFDPQDPAFSEIYSTTWQELESRGLVRGHHMMQTDSFELRGPGWLVAMSLTGKLETPEFQERFGRLSAALKRQVDGRRQKQVTTVASLAKDTGIAADWIYNVIKSNVWQQQNRVGAEFDEHELVWIPIDFNMEPL